MSPRSVITVVTITLAKDCSIKQRGSKPTIHAMPETKLNGIIILKSKYLALSPILIRANQIFEIVARHVVSSNALTTA